MRSEVLNDCVKSKCATLNSAWWELEEQGSERRNWWNKTEKEKYYCLKVIFVILVTSILCFIVKRKN